MVGLLANLAPNDLPSDSFLHQMMPFSDISCSCWTIQMISHPATKWHLAVSTFFSFKFSQIIY